MTKKTVRIAAGLAAIPVLLVGWWLASPLFLDREVDEAFPLSATAAVPADMTVEEVEKIMAEAASVDDEPMTEAMPTAETTSRVEPASGPEAIKSGRFRDADDFHRGSGEATIYRLDDGSHVLRLVDFRVTNGPDLRVLLSPAADVRSRGELDAAGYVELGKLKGNVGDQNYTIPDGVDVGGQGSVIIYCKPFHVLFSVAPLSEVGA